jgi:hypothetical protein
MNSAKDLTNCVSNVMSEWVRNIERGRLQVFLLRLVRHIQGDPGGKVSILGGHRIDHSKQKMYIYMCSIPNGFRDRQTDLR